MTVLLPVADARRARRHVLGLLRLRRGEALACAAVLVGATVAGLAVPPLLGALVDAALDRDAGRADLIAAGLLAAVVASAALTGAATTLVARLGERLLADLREAVVARALAVPLADVEAAGTGDLLARVGPDVDAVSRAFREAVPVVLLSGLALALTGVGLLALDPWFVVAALGALPVQALAARRYLRRSGPLFAAERVAVSGWTQRLHDALTGARALRARREEAEALDGVRAASATALDRSIRAARAGADYGAKLNLAELVALAGVLGAGFLLVRADGVTVGAATAAALYVHRLFGPVMELLGLVDTLQDATASLARLVGVATMPPVPAGGGLAPDGHRLELRDVHLAYGLDGDVLHGVDLDLREGEHAALVGPTGAGKSSLVRLAAAVQAPTAGTVRLGGRRLDELGAAGWRRHVVLVTQELHVFAGPLADDLRLAAPGAPEAELRSALAAVGALAWVDTLPQGLDTVIGHGGRRLTSVQAQQLALARVLLADPDVVLLDEATAEAGSSSAAELDAAAAAVTAGRSALVVAHRLSHAAAAQRVVVLDAGRVVEAGTHDELVRAGGEYARLWAAWSTTS